MAMSSYATGDAAGLGNHHEQSQLPGSTVFNADQREYGLQQVIQTESSAPYVVRPKKGERSRSG